MQPRLRAAFAVFALTALMLTLPVQADDPPPASLLLRNLTPRSLGPAITGGRITDVAVVENRPTTLYIATASGGLWKTINNGTTWTPIFDEQDVQSIGDVTVAPSDPNVVWIGTGEANARNSVSWGDGVYCSTDGGQSWTHVGLRETQHVGRIVVHPRDPHTAYVAALGHCFGPNTERGLFKTTDGGRTWRHVLELGDDCGCVDVVMDPEDPETLYAAAFQVRRDGTASGNPAVQFGSKSGIHKTEDGGKTWRRLTKGLPERPLGRIGLDSYRRDSHILYAVVPTDRTDISVIPGQPPKTGDNVETGGVFRSEDRGETWIKVNDLCPRPFYFGKVRIDPTDHQRVYVLGVQLFLSEDGGATFRPIGLGRIHADHHALWINPSDPAHLVLGCDGGLSFSYDRGATWDSISNLPIAQFYGVAVDLRKPYRVYGGLQDNGTWVGPSANHEEAGVGPESWTKLLGADGFRCQVDPEDPTRLYAQSQWGWLARIHVPSGKVQGIQPTTPGGSSPVRYGWSAPLLLSPHQAKTVYYGGNYLFRSQDGGDRWQPLSNELVFGPTGTLATISESPRTAGVIYTGSDDGRLCVTRDDGRSWTDLSLRLVDVPQRRWITCVQASYHDAGTVYLAIDRHRWDDRRPWLFRSADYGMNWQPLMANLPAEGPVHVVLEDRRNRDLLFAGTEFGLFVSLNGGSSWSLFKNGLPRVPIHDLVIHPRDNELVIATHGRGLYVLDVAPLQQLTSEVLAARAHLFDVKPTVAYQPRTLGAPYGSQTFLAANPPYGTTFAYYLRERRANGVRFHISDSAGRPITELTGSGEIGLQKLTWDLRSQSATAGQAGPIVAPGEYTVTLTAGSVSQTKRLRVEAE